MQNNASGCNVYVSSAIMSRISRHFYMQKLTFYGQIEGSRLAERFAAKTNLETGEGDYKKREGEECNETNVCKHDEDVKDPGGGK